MELNKVLQPDYIAQLKSLPLQAKWVLQGALAGRHRSPFHGFSSEFSQYKGYAPGDDLKHLDWKVYGKNDQLVIKQFRDETNCSVYLIIDSSLSMNYGENPSKLFYAQVLAASIGLLAFQQRDAVSLAYGADAPAIFLPPKNNAPHFKRVLDVLEKIRPHGVTDLRAILETVSLQIKAGSMVFIFSDLWQQSEALCEGLKSLRAKHPLVSIIHTLHPDETAFFSDRNIEIEDLENQLKLKISAAHLRPQYLQTLQAHINRIRQECDGLNMRFIPLQTDLSYFEALRRILLRRH